MKKIQNIRTDYNLYKMTRDNLLYSPIEQFKLWFSQLEYCSDFNSTTLSTYSKKNGVQSRIVLLKEIKKDGFVFYTNYNSLKAQQISQNNNVSLCFFGLNFNVKSVYKVLHLNYLKECQNLISNNVLNNRKLLLGFLIKALLWLIEKN